MRQKFWICSALVLLTVVAYWPITISNFINYDDPPYVTANYQVRAGLTKNGLIWAFTSIHGNNWHPLTSISHMADCQFFGLKPAGPHIVNLVFHVANTLLLFAVLLQSTNCLWRGAIVAALFAWHPMHVESVAWVSERKDVLSGFFWLLTILFYLLYAGAIMSKVRSKKSTLFYSLSLFCFILGLLSKPMVVSLPFVLMLLDFWPLGRIVPMTTDGMAVQKASLVSAPWLRLVVEKIPFFLLAGASAVVTVIVQAKSGALYPLDHLPLGFRVANATVSYVRYLGKLFWPEPLFIPYPLPDHWPALIVIGAGLLLLIISGAVVMQARRLPPLLTGWYWLLGTLVPVIGLVQVGMQAMADRYTYIPSIGFFIMVVWGAGTTASRWPHWKGPLGVMAVALLIACLCGTNRQVRYWKDSVTLFAHTKVVSPNNFRACYNLGQALLAEGQIDSGMANLFQASNLKPEFADLQGTIGQAYANQGKMDEAVRYYHRALELNPNLPEALNNLAWILATSNDDRIRNGAEAVQLAERACAATHNQVPVMLGTLAAAYAEAGRFKEAVDTGDKAYQTALASGDNAVAQANKKLLELYRANRAYRQGMKP